MIQLLIVFLMNSEAFMQLLFCLQALTVVLKFLTALCAFVGGAALLTTRIRRWIRRRSRAKSAPALEPAPAGEKEGGTAR